MGCGDRAERLRLEKEEGLALLDRLGEDDLDSLLHL